MNRQPSLLPATSIRLVAPTVRSPATAVKPVRFPERWQLVAPVLGLVSAASLAWLPGTGVVAAATLYAAFCLGLGLLYLALLPSCERGGLITVGLGIANISAALSLFDWPSAMHAWLSLQTVIAAVWLVRDQYTGERSLAGLLLGLNAGAVAAMGFVL